MSKVLYIFDAADWGSRIPVAEAARNAGHHVVLGMIGKLSAAQEHSFPIVYLEKKHMRFGVSALFDFIFQIRKIINNEKPDILHTVTLKYGFICALAALPNPGMRKIFTIAGLGYLFHGHDQKSKYLQILMKPILSFLFKRPHTTLIFQNNDDLTLLTEGKYVTREKTALIKGSGVNLDLFLKERQEADVPLILMPTRLVREKGISVFIEAARILKNKNVQARFQIAGGETTHNPKAISADEMRGMIKDGAAEWLGRIDNLPELLSRTTLVVYPSYYGEGIPRVLLEACAAGCAIVTTDHTGCREAVTHGLNGLLVPIKNPQAVADAIEKLLNQPHVRLKMGQKSKRRAESEFDIKKIAKLTLEIYESY